MKKINPKYLPSKKFVTMLTIVIAVSLILVAFSFKGEKIYKSTNNNVKAISNIDKSLETFKQLDSDGDNLPDWQETLYGTDPKKDDTDNDGTRDEEEMILNRDPLKPNTALAGQEPNDKISPEIIAKEENMEQEYDSLSLTDKLARNMFSQYIASKQMNNNELSDTAKEIIVENSIPLDAGSAKKYAISDISTFPNINIKTDTKNYINQVAKAFIMSTSSTSVKKVDESTILTSAMSSNSGEALKQLDLNIVLYKKTLEQLSLMSVPENVIKIHLDLLNNISSKIFGLEGLMVMFTDPVKAMMSLKDYSSGDDGLYLSIMNIISLAEQYSITFTKNEYGYYLINMIKLQ